MLKTLMEEVDNTQDQMNNASREIKLLRRNQKDMLEMKNYNRNEELIWWAVNNVDMIRKNKEAWRKRKIPYDITYLWNLKHNTNELIYETETDSQT